MSRDGRKMKYDYYYWNSCLSVSFGNYVFVFVGCRCLLTRMRVWQNRAMRQTVQVAVVSKWINIRIVWCRITRNTYHEVAKWWIYGWLGGDRDDATDQFSGLSHLVHTYAAVLDDLTKTCWSWCAWARMLIDETNI